MFHAVICSDLIEQRVIFSQLYQRVGIWGNSHQKHQTRGTIMTYRSNIVIRQLPCTNKKKNSYTPWSCISGTFFCTTENC